MKKAAQDKRRFLRETQIDDEHNLIRSRLNELYELVGGNADYLEVMAVFMDLEKMVLKHFETEESEIKNLPQNEEVKTHFKGHKDSHDVLRSSFEYATDKFKANFDSLKVPNIVELLPMKYFEELEDWDGKMMALIHNIEKSDAA